MRLELNAAGGRILPLRPKNDGRAINATYQCFPSRSWDTRCPILTVWSSVNCELNPADKLLPDLANAFEQRRFIRAALQRDEPAYAQVGVALRSVAIEL